MKQYLQCISIALFYAAQMNAQSSCDGTVYSGDGTYYIDAEAPASQSSLFNCSFKHPEIKPYYGAMNNTQYATADYCGACVELTGNVGTKGTQIIEIVDKCPECLVGDIDLSTQAFLAVFGDLVIGRANMSWHEVACPWSTAPVNITTQGSNQWYAKLIIAKHKNRINKVEMYSGSSWVNLIRSSDNGWVGSVNVTGLTQVRITDIFGQQLIVDNVEVASGIVKTFQGTSNFTPCLSTDIANYEAVRNVSIYPNPASEGVVFDDMQGIKMISIYNLMGDLVYEESQPGGASRVNLSLLNLSSGSYIVKLSNGSEVVYTNKLIKL
ncbi:MAG: expansin EXLX1 family cellulose-binding protein [Bacteroidetes bacterium]|nr:expansin EXLX1 family cellulose-binding protein [Bacteroidota bacterium]